MESVEEFRLRVGGLLEVDGTDKQFEVRVQVRDDEVEYVTVSVPHCPPMVILEPRGFQMVALSLQNKPDDLPSLSDWELRGIDRHSLPVDEANVIGAVFLAAGVVKAKLDEFLLEHFKEWQHMKAVEERAERERAKQREEVVAEREHMLLWEHLGDEVRIRIRGYKRPRKAIVHGHKVDENTYDVKFVYVNERRHGPPTYGVRYVQSLEVKDGGRYRKVWDDGKDDLSPWDR